MPSRSFRVSEKFLKQLEMIQNYYKNELGLDMTQKELLDEMIELYHCRIMLKSNILDELFKEELRNNLQLYMKVNIKMINEIDPRIYNFKNLKLEDQVVVASQFKIFLLVKKEKEDLKETADKQNSLTKFFYEVAIEELDEVEEKIKDTIIQTIISFIENYDYFVKELETDDYFYGLEDSKDE